MVKSATLFGILICCVFLLCGCGSGGFFSGTQRSVGQVNALSFTATAPFSASAGTNVPITLTVLNTDTVAYTYQFSGCDEANVVISHFGQIVRTLRDPSVCSPLVRTGTIAAGAEKSFTLSWDKTDDSLRALPSGLYQVQYRLAPYTISANGNVVQNGPPSMQVTIR